ncbi:MAG: TIR domain-containing protein [Chloroflexi bacterium]|nr:TIR domain-containing protein [Chloroflexota bacterium]
MAEKTEATSSVFISYSRRNKGFAEKLNDSLDNSGIDAWVDWEGIPLSSDWMDEITRAIEGADAFLFIITPDSLASEVCGEELELGLKYNKKLVPILHIEPEKGSTMHESLAATNWVYMREQDDYDNALLGLIESIQTDLGWVREHTRLLVRSKEWDDKGRGNSFLLQGDDLNEAETWMVEAADKEGREVVPLQGEYIQASRQLATKRQRSLLIGVSAALVVSIGLAIFALFQRGVAVEQTELALNNEAAAHTQEAIAVANEHARATQQVIAEKNEAEAVQNEIVARAQRAAAEARIYQTEAGELDISTLLAIDSWQRSPSFLAEDILRRNTSVSPVPIAQVSQGGRVWRIKRSPDGVHFASAGENATACLWTVDDAEQKFCVEHDKAVYDIVFSKEGDFFMAAGKDGTVRLWDANDGALIKSYDFGGTIIWDLDMNPDGSKLAAAREDGSISIINLNDLEAPPQIWEHDSAVYKVVFSPDGKWLGVGTSSGETYLWNVDDVYYVSGATHNDEVYALDFSFDSKWMVTGGADSVARSSEVSRRGTARGSMTHGDWIEFIDFSPEGNWFVTASDDNNLRVWDVETGIEKLRMQHDGFVLRMDITDNGGWIASTGYDQTARVWNAASGSEMIHIPIGTRGTAILFNEEGTRLIVGDDKGNITLWDTSVLLSRLNYIEFPELVRGAHYSPNGEILAVNTDEKNVRLFPVEDILSVKTAAEGREILPTKGLTYDLAYSSDNKWVAVEETREDKIRLYNFETEEILILEHGAKVYGFAFSPDNTQVVTAGGDSFIRIWDLESGEEIDSIENPAPLQSVAYHPNGKHLAAGMENKINIWDVETKERVAGLFQSGEYHNIAYSPDGAWFAAGSSEGIIYLVSVEHNYSFTDNFLRMNGQPYSLTFSPDGKLLAGGSSNYFAYLWDVSLGQEISRIPHSDVVRSVSFSPDGLELATVARKIVQIWDIPALPVTTTDALVDTACSHLVSNLSEIEWELIYSGDEYRLLCPDLEMKK